MALRLKAVLVTEPDSDPRATVAVVKRALKGGLSAVLVRRPDDDANGVYDLARRLRPPTRQAGCLLLVSDRADVAVAVDADGVHLGARSLPVPAARRVVGSRLIGCSVHNLDEVGQVEEEGADYLFLGHLFDTMSHPGEPPLGLDAYREAVLRTRIPVVAIGGISGENVRLVAQAGGTGAAAISSFYNVQNPAETARAFRAAFAS